MPRITRVAAPPAGIIIFAPRALRSSVANQAQSAAREKKWLRSNENIAAKWAEKLIGQASSCGRRRYFLVHSARILALPQNNFPAATQFSESAVCVKKMCVVWSPVSMGRGDRRTQIARVTQSQWSCH
jgi:hypothetical protein